MADLHDDRAAGDLRVHLAGQRRAPLDRAQRRAGLVGPGHERGPGDGHAVARPPARRTGRRTGRARSTPGARPCPARRAPTVRAYTSSTSAKRLGTGRPNAPWWVGWRDVENPMAPACMASRTRSHIVVDLVVGRGPLLAAEHEEAQRGVADEGADVEALRRAVERGQVLGERLEAPVDARRRAPPSTCPRRSRACGRSVSRCSGRVGATPKPQLPMTTLVTPCQLDGVRSPSQRIWAS